MARTRLAGWCALGVVAVAGVLTLAPFGAPVPQVPQAAPYFFITGSTGNNVQVVDPCATVQTLAGFSNPRGVAVSSDGSRAYVANQGSNSVSVLDAVGLTTLTNFGTGTGSAPKSVAVNPNPAYPELYVATTTAVQIYDTGAMGYTLQASFPVANVAMVAVSPDGFYLAMTSTTGNSAALASVASRTIVRSTAGLSAPVGVAFNAEGTRYYVAESTASRLAVFNGATGVSLGTIALTGNPFFVACAPRANVIYAVQRGGTLTSGTLHVVNGAAGSVMTTLPLGFNAAGVSFHPTLDIALVANQSDATVTEVDSALHAVIQTCGQAPAPYAFGQAIKPATMPAPVTLTTGTPLPDGAVNCAYSVSLALAGGVGPYTWAVTSGALPAGLSLNPATGAITGTPTASGAAAFTVAATDSEWVSGSKGFSLTIQPALAVATASPLPPAIRWGVYSHALAASGGTSPYSWSLTAGALPSGLVMNSAGVISGTPDTLQTATFTAQVSDACGKTASAGLSLTVQGGLDITHLAPMAAQAGSGPFLLVVQGTGFGSGSVIRWNGIDQATTWISASEVQATIPASYLAVAGFADVSVYAPSPVAGVTPTRTFWIAPAGSPGPILHLGNGTGSLNRFDTWQNALIAPFTGYASSYEPAVEAGGGRLWLCGSFNLKRLDPASGLVLASATGLNLSEFPTPSPARDRLYLKWSNSGVGFLDPDTLAGGLSVSTAAWARSVVASPDGTRLFIATGPNGTRVARTSDALVVKDIVYASDGFSLSADGTRLYLSDATGGVVRALDSSTYQVVATYTGLAAPGRSLLVAGDTRLCVLDGNYLKEVDLASGAVTTLAGPLNGAAYLTAHPSGAWLYVSNPNNGQVLLWDIRNNRPRVEESYVITYPNAGPCSMEPPSRALAMASPAALPHGMVGSFYRCQVLAYGGRPYYTWTVTAGSLPAGLAMDSRGEITGYPTALGTASFTAQATDFLGAVVSRAFTLTVDPPPYTVLISPASPLPNVTVSQCGITSWPYAVTLSGTGGTGPYSFRILSGSLPAGLTLNGTTGVISGTCCATGTSNFSLYCEDATGVGSGSLPYQISVTPGPAITSPATLPTAGLGMAYTYTFAGTGNTPLSWTYFNSPPPSPSYPPGLTLASNGTLSGTPNATGTYSFAVQLTDRNGATANWAGSLAVVTPLPAPALSAFQPASYVAGGDAFTLTLTGSNFTSQSQVLWNGSPRATTYLSPTSLAAAIAAADVASAATATVAVQNPAPGGGTASLPYTVSAPGPRGYLAYRLKGVGVFDTARGVVYKHMPLTGLHPEFVVVNRSDSLLYLLREGTLERYDSQALSLLNATTLSGASSTAASRLLLSPAEDTLYAAMGGTVFRMNASTLSASTFFVDPFPGGGGIVNDIALSQDGGRLYVSCTNSLAVLDAATGTVLGDLWPQCHDSGFRMAVTPDGRDLAVGGSDSIYIFDLATLKLSRTFGFGVYASSMTTPVGAMVFNSTGSRLYFTNNRFLLDGFTAGVGVADYATGRVLWYTPLATSTPLHLAVDNADQNLYGSPADPNGASVLVYDTATGGLKGSMAVEANQVGPRSMAIAPGGAAAPAVQTSSPLPPASLGAAYALQLIGIGGKPPYVWSVASGALPAGVVLDPAKGTLSGSPSSAGNSNFTAQLTDSLSATATKAFSLWAGPSLGITTPGLPGGVAGVAYPSTTQLSVAGGTPPYTWSVVAGALPAGLSLDPSTAVLSGTPALAQPASFTVQVSGGGTATRSYTVDVINPPPYFQGFSPPSSYAGQSGLTLGLLGSHFVTTSQALWQGVGRATTYVSGTLVNTQLSSADLAAAGVYAVALNNPSPGGGSLSRAYTLCAAVAGPQSSLRITRSGASVILNWAAEAGITSYQIKRCGTLGGLCQPASALATVSGTTYTDNVGTSGLNYAYAVEAVGPCGNVP